MKEKLIGWKQEEKFEASVKRTSTNFFSGKFLQYIKTPLKDIWTKLKKTSAILFLSDYTNQELI